MLGSSLPTAIDVRGPWHIHYHKGRKQPYTIWRDNHTWFFADNRDEAIAWIARRNGLAA